MTNTREFDRDGILVGWYGTIRDAKGHNVRAFIPRPDKEIAAARARVLRLRDPLFFLAAPLTMGDRQDAEIKAAFLESNIFLAATQGYGREPMTA